MVIARDLVQAYAYPEGMSGSELIAQFRVRYGEPCPSAITESMTVGSVTAEQATIE